MDRHRCRLDGYRVLLFPMRHLLPALRRAIRLHRRGACKVRLFSVLVPVLPVAGHRQRGGGHFGSGLHDVVHALAGKRRHSFILWNGRPALADHRGEFRRPWHHWQDWCGYGVGGDHSRSGLEHHRLVLVQTRADHRRLEPEPTAYIRGHQQSDSPHALGVSRHGVGSPGLRCGGKPQAHRTAGLSVRYIGRSGGLCAIDDGHSGHYSQRRTGQLVSAFRARLCAHVQSPGRQHHHGARGNGLCRLAAGLAVHVGANGQGDR